MKGERKTKARVNGYLIDVSEYKICGNYVDFVTNGKRFRTGKNNFILEECEENGNEKGKRNPVVKMFDDC